MKSTTDNWNDPNTLATNESGFSGLPGGYRSHLDGNFSTIGDYGSWWSFTEYTEFSTYNAWYRFLDYYTGNAGRDWWGNKQGETGGAIRLMDVHVVALEIRNTEWNWSCLPC